MPSLTINSTVLKAAEGTTLLEAIEKAGGKVPTLCHHKALTPYGACRLHRSGVDARTIQHLLGHSDLETTLRYLRSASQETKDHGQKLEAAFGGQRRAKGIAASMS